MKLIMAIIKPFKLDEVRQAPGLVSALACVGQGSQRSNESDQS